jgi:hypothetical protein
MRFFLALGQHETIMREALPQSEEIFWVVQNFEESKRRGCCHFFGQHIKLGGAFNWKILFLTMKETLPSI